jgi:hypothetical protein
MTIWLKLSKSNDFIFDSSNDWFGSREFFAHPSVFSTLDFRTQTSICSSV